MIQRSFLIAALATALLASGSSVYSQQPQQRTQVQIQPNPLELVVVAQRIGIAMDRGDAGQLWDAASAVLKRQMPRDQFIRAAEQRRSAYGVLTGRSWRTINQSTLATAQGLMPAGQYVSITFRANDQRGRMVVELVSFTLEPDQQWRMVGATVR